MDKINYWSVKTVCETCVVWLLLMDTVRISSLRCHVCVLDLAQRFWLILATCEIVNSVGSVAFAARVPL